MFSCSDGLDACFAFLPLGLERPGERLELDYAMESSPRNLLLVPPICVATIYEGHAPLTYLRQRVQQLVEANRWLAGRLRKGSGKPYVAVPCRVGSGHLFELPLEVEEPSAQQLTALVSKTALPCGLWCLNRDVPLFRVTVLVGENHFVAPGRPGAHATYDHAIRPESRSPYSNASKGHQLDPPL